MLILKGLVAVAALAHSATAFHPFVPDYRCAEFHTCSSKRTVEADVKERDLGHTLKIVQRLPKNNLPHDTQIRQLASRLSRKYQRGSPIKSVAIERGEFDKRSNTYPISSAAVPTTTNSAGIDQDGTDFSYFTKVKLGSKGTPLNMLLDTGAGTSWVMGHDCKSEPCKTRNAFGAEDSDTFKKTGTNFELNYGSGNVSGSMATDTLSLAGLNIKATFGIADITSPDFNNFPIDGILGLAQSKGPNPTFMETVVESKVLTSNIFGVSISRSAHGPNDGVINFGAPDTSRFTGSLSYSDVHGQQAGDWAIPLDDVSFDGKKAGIQFKIAYIDTGTSYIFTKMEEVKKLHDVIPGATSEDGITYRVPCTTTKDLKFIFGGNSYTVSSVDWVGPEVDGKCTSNVYGHDVVGDAWLLGDTFLKNVYAVFDVDQNRIGFAPKAAPPVTSSSSSTSPAGGPNSLSNSPSSTLPSSDGASMSGSLSTVAASNASSTGSSSGTVPSQTSTPALETTGTGATPTAPPGLGGHQTSDSSTAEAVESSASPSPTPSKQSGAIRLDSSLASAVLAVLSLATLIS